jgi:hypothetical protein
VTEGFHTTLKTEIYWRCNLLGFGARVVGVPQGMVHARLSEELLSIRTRIWCKVDASMVSKLRILLVLASRSDILENVIARWPT